MREFHIPGRYREDADEFFGNYDVEEFVICTEKIIKNENNRICRFCGKDGKSTVFNNKAHLIPEQLGNQILFSDFECDTCNKKFGTEYESHLAHFLGMFSTLCGIQGKRKVADFTSPGYKLKATHSKVDNPFGTITLERNNVDDTTFIIDSDSGKTTISYRSNSYIPLRVYKALLKIALSCISEEQVNDYRLAIEYLMSDKWDEFAAPYTQGRYYVFSPAYALEKPICLLFRKKANNPVLCTHIFLLACGNTVFQIIVPLHIADAYYAATGKQIRAYFCPPLFFEEIQELNDVRVDDYLLSMSSKELCKDGWGKLEFNVEAGDNTSVVNNNKIVKIEIIREPKE